MLNAIFARLMFPKKMFYSDAKDQQALRPLLSLLMKQLREIYLGSWSGTVQYGKI